jgi:hypothetical protein
MRQLDRFHGENQLAFTRARAYDVTNHLQWPREKNHEAPDPSGGLVH